MGENLGCCRSFHRVQAKERGKQGSPGGSQKRKFCSEDVSSCLGSAGETERAGVGKTFEAGPGGFGGNATKFEYLEKKSVSRDGNICGCPPSKADPLRSFLAATDSSSGARRICNRCSIYRFLRHISPHLEEALERGTTKSLRAG